MGEYGHKYVTMVISILKKCVENIRLYMMTFEGFGMMKVVFKIYIPYLICNDCCVCHANVYRHGDKFSSIAFRVLLYIYIPFCF